MRKIAIITGNRAEYGLLRNVIRNVHQASEMQLLLFVTGAHLATSMGLTISEIEKDQVPIHSKVPIMEEDVDMGITKIMSNAMASFGHVFESTKPDIALFLGDRYETFASVAAAVATHTPIAHCHGGEISQGSIDNQWRHAITKMANIHFCATEEFRKRIIQMGEEPNKVFNVGALGIENINNINLLSRTELEASLDFKLMQRNVVMTLHAETAKPKSILAEQTKMVLETLLRFHNLGIILTYPNPDEGHEAIISELIRFNKANPQRSVLVESLGAKRYLSALNTVDLVVGNSSSGLIEAPSFHIPTINIGSRQDGRLAPATVLHADFVQSEIIQAIQLGLSKPFRAKLNLLANPYDGGNSAAKIVEVLSSMSLDKIIFKKFYDLPLS